MNQENCPKCHSVFIAAALKQKQQQQKTNKQKKTPKKCKPQTNQHKILALSS